MIALIAVAVLLILALLTTLTAAPRTALAVRAQAAAGYERWEPVIDQAADGTRVALDPLVGEPIGEVWTLSCRLEGGLGTRQVQECRLSVDLSYELAGSTPRGGAGRRPGGRRPRRGAGVGTVDGPRLGGKAGRRAHRRGAQRVRGRRRPR